MPKLDPNTRQEVMAYLKENSATKEERREVWQWVHHGADIYGNPWLYAWEGGFTMDLISALRFDRELREWYDSMTPEEREAEFGTHDDLLICEEL